MTVSGSELIRIADDDLSATIDPHGAQLMSLRMSTGIELLWQGDPAFWPDRAPLLFPVIGPIRDGRIRHAGKTYPMPAHGFAQQRSFTVVEQSPAACTFELRADAETRTHYPFEFVVRVMFALSSDTLEVTVAVTNTGDESMPADVGFHPGFAWPLVPGDTREGHAIVFEREEHAPIRRGVDDPIFLVPQEHPTPVEGRVLRLRDDVFRENAIVFDHLTSRALTYGPLDADGSLRLRIAFPDSPYLAIWSRPGAGFVAIEPWQGLPSPVDFVGLLQEKPGIAVIAPGDSRRWRLQVTTVRALEDAS
jgi:galactose mutarotase-like enzyme